MTATSDALTSSATAAGKSGPREEASEALSPWSKRWAESQTGWHEKDVNHVLLKHGSFIIPDLPSEEKDDETCIKDKVRIFVPLCGKSLDLAFLASQKAVSEVVGVEGVRKALEEFAAENPTLGIKPEESVGGPYEKFVGKHITLLKGDYFDFDEVSAGGKFDAVWDRASLVAIQPDVRENYVRVMGGIMKPGGTVLLAVLDRRAGTQEAKLSGPPFSVDEKEVRRLFENSDWVESVTKVAEFDEFELRPDRAEMWRGQGLKEMYELCFVIKAKKP